MKIQGAIIEERGITFAIIIVKKHILDSQHQSEEANHSFGYLFPGIPLVLMAQDSRGIPTYRGRKDIVDFLADVHISQIPWKEYTCN